MRGRSAGHDPSEGQPAAGAADQAGVYWYFFGIVKLRLTAVSDPQHDGFTAGFSPVSWGSIDELSST